MSNSKIQIVGVRPPDEKWKKMKAIFINCRELGIEVPEDVYSYFDGNCPKEEDDGGSMISLMTRYCVWPYEDETKKGFRIILNRMEEDVETLLVTYRKDQPDKA